MSDNGPDRGRGGGRDQLREEAATWFARMRSDDAERHRPEFEAWLARGAVHRAAYNRIGEIFAAGKVLKSELPISDGNDGHRTDGPAVRSARVRAALVGAAGVLCVIGAWNAAGHWTATSSDVAAVADRGIRDRGRLGMTRVRFGDHGTAVLDIDGLLATSVGGKLGVSRLEQGRVRFSVPTGAPRQLILAGPATVATSGGTFDLWLRHDGALEARVLSGGIQLRPAVLRNFVDDGGAMIGVRAGQRYRISDNGAGGLFTDGAGPDWPAGILEYRETPLALVVAEANRYSSVKLVVGSQDLAGRRVSGRFRIDDVGLLAQRVAAALNLSVDRSQPGMIILRDKKMSDRP